MSYTKEPGYIYIETEADKKKYAPKLSSDEVDYGRGWEEPSDDGVFGETCVYRRKIAPSPWLPCTPSTTLPPHVSDETHIIEVYSDKDGHRQLLEVFAFGYRDSDTTHYRLIELVAPPVVVAVEPEKTQEEKDFEAYKKWSEPLWCDPSEDECFIAGAKYARNAQPSASREAAK